MSATRIDFTSADEANMRRAAWWGKVIAIASMAASVLSLLVSLGSAEAADVVADVLGTAVQIVLSVVLYSACLQFTRVADTDDDDPRHLVGGFRDLRTYFAIQGVLIILALLCIPVAVLVLWG